jgi:hypothetical protein
MSTVEADGLRTWGVHSLLYFAYMCVRDLFIGEVIYLAKKIKRWWYFTCKKPENIICDGILHVNMLHYFKIPYFTCTFFTKFTYNEYIGPYFLSHVVLRFSPVKSPSLRTLISLSLSEQKKTWSKGMEAISDMEGGIIDSTACET